MKKIILIITVFFITGCFSHNNSKTETQKWIEYKVKENGLVNFYQIDNNTTIYSKLGTVTYKDNGQIINLKEALENKNITIEDFINKMDIYKQANDGGSKYFVSNKNLSDVEFYLAQCKSTIGIKDIFIDTDKEEILHYCVVEKMK